MKSKAFLIFPMVWGPFLARSRASAPPWPSWTMLKCEHIVNNMGKLCTSLKKQMGKCLLIRHTGVKTMWNNHHRLRLPWKPYVTYLIPEMLEFYSKTSIQPIETSRRNCRNHILLKISNLNTLKKMATFIPTYWTSYKKLYCYTDQFFQQTWSLQYQFIHTLYCCLLLFITTR